MLKTGPPRMHRTMAHTQHPSRPCTPLGGTAAAGLHVLLLCAGALGCIQALWARAGPGAQGQ